MRNAHVFLPVCLTGVCYCTSVRDTSGDNRDYVPLGDVEAIESEARSCWQGRAYCRSACESVNGGFRRVSPVAPRLREDPLTELTAGARPRPQERVLVPQG